MDTLPTVVISRILNFAALPLFLVQRIGERLGLEDFPICTVFLKGESYPSDRRVAIKVPIEVTEDFIRRYSLPRAGTPVLDWNNVTTLSYKLMSGASSIKLYPPTIPGERLVYLRDSLRLIRSSHILKEVKIVKRTGDGTSHDISNLRAESLEFDSDAMFYPVEITLPRNLKDILVLAVDSSEFWEHLHDIDAPEGSGTSLVGDITLRSVDPISPEVNDTIVLRQSELPISLKVKR